MMLPAKTLHQWKPFLCVFLELVDLVRIDHVPQVAGDHGSAMNGLTFMGNLLRDLAT
jgi:hypothetical protein